MVHRHPQHFSLDRPVSETCEAISSISPSLHACGSHARGTPPPFPLAPLTTFCREALCKGFAVSSCPLVIVVALTVLIVHSCSVHLAVLMLHSCHDLPWTFWISSLYAPPRKSWQVHITNASCCCLAANSARELLLVTLSTFLRARCGPPN